MKLLRLLLLCIAACAPGCHQAHIINPPPDVAGADAADPCHQACAKLEANGCAGITEPGCTDNCERDQAQGVATQLDPSAVLGATTVQQLSGLAGVTCTGGGQ